MDDEPHHTHDLPPGSVTAVPSLSMRLLSGSIDIGSDILREKCPLICAIPAMPATPSHPV
jgi:hypothetical protein